MLLHHSSSGVAAEGISAGAAGTAGTAGTAAGAGSKPKLKSSKPLTAGTDAAGPGAPKPPKSSMLLAAGAEEGRKRSGFADGAS